jgi:5-deoxy-glucuronate isomerase
MSHLRIRPQKPDDQGRIIDITPASAGWQYVGFEVRRLGAGSRTSVLVPSREACVLILTGAADIEVEGRSLGCLGGRQSVFDDTAPGAVYLPPSTPCTLVARDNCEIAVCTAPAAGGVPVRVLAPERMTVETRGQGTNTRKVRNILPETEPAQSLLITEVITPGGHWSSYPPHRHDEDAEPRITALEETYYHRLRPSQGFAFQRVYTDDRSIDETICVEDGDVVLVPRGYHPVGTPHGYDLYYLNVMAGPVRKWIFHNDPAHAWLMKR